MSLSLTHPDLISKIMLYVSENVCMLFLGCHSQNKDAILLNIEGSVLYQARIPLNTNRILNVPRDHKRFYVFTSHVAENTGFEPVNRFHDYCFPDSCIRPLCQFSKLRKLRDSNPRTTCMIAGFQDQCIRPLCQTSVK